MNTIQPQGQRSLDWFRSRLGCITGSQAGLLMKSGRAKDKLFSDTAYGYLFQLAGERTLNPEIVNDDEMFSFYLEQTTSQSKAMRFGTEQEENARAMYTQVTGRNVEEVSLCHHPEIPFLASSPDGITEDKGIKGCIEIKCPTLATFTRYATEIASAEDLQRVNPDYFYQCMCHMACTDAEFCDFVAYSPFVDNPIHIVRIPRNEEEIKALTERVKLAEEVIRHNYAKITSNPQ